MLLIHPPKTKDKRLWHSMQLSCSALDGATNKSLQQTKSLNFEFLCKISWWGGERHLAAVSAKEDAVALLSPWCSTSKWQDATDRVVWILIELYFIVLSSCIHEICIPYIGFIETFMTISLDYAIKVLFSFYDSFYHVNL